VDSSILVRALEKKKRAAAPEGSCSIFPIYTGLLSCV
jgi:hypothetical protein